MEDDILNFNITIMCNIHVPFIVVCVTARLETLSHEGNLYLIGFMF